MPAIAGRGVAGLLPECFLQWGAVAPSRRPGVARSRGPAGATCPPNRPADDARLAPAGPRDSPLGGRRDGASAAWPPNPQRYSVRVIPETCPAASVCFSSVEVTTLPRMSPGPTQLCPRVTREPPGAPAERSGSERRARVRGGASRAVSARLEDVEKVLTTFDLVAGSEVAGSVSASRLPR